MRTVILLSALVWLAATSAARAQLTGMVVVPPVVEDTQFTCVSVSCSGDECAASLLTYHYTSREVKILIRLSNDGGHNWRTCDPGLPDQHTQTANRIWKILQIDSANIIAVGDTALVLRSFDAGRSWSRQALPNPVLKIIDVSFSTPLEGILIDARNIFTTKDGGLHWIEAAFHPREFASCHAYGNSRFAVCAYSSGVLYSTLDQWETIDSTAPVVTGFGDSVSRIIAECAFGSGDTLFAAGNTLVRVPGANTKVYPLIFRSTDRGNSWTKVYEDTSTIRGDVTSLSSVDHDTIFAACSVGRSGFLVSTDRGTTWAYDTLVLDTAFNPAATWGIGRNSSGEFVATMGYYNTALVVGSLMTAAVQTYHNIPYYSYLYPNPVSDVINVLSQATNQRIVIYDILGREATSGLLDGQGHGRIDVRTLPSGLYNVMLLSGTSLLPISPVVITHQ